MAHRRRGTKSFLFVTDRNRGRRDYELQVSITSKCREASVAKQVSRCREASVAKQVAKQLWRSNCGEASVRSKCCETSVAKQPVATRGATCRAHKKRRNNSSPETIAFNRKTNGHVWLSQPKTTMCSLRTTCFLLLWLCFAGIPYLGHIRLPQEAHSSNQERSATHLRNLPNLRSFRQRGAHNLPEVPRRAALLARATPRPLTPLCSPATPSATLHPVPPYSSAIA